MNFRSLTWPQVVLLLGSLAGIVAAYKLLGEGAAAALGVATHLAMALSGPKDPPAPPGVSEATPAPQPVAPSASAAKFGILALAIAGCGVVAAPDGAALLEGNAAIAHCEVVASNAPDGGHVAAWRACKAEAGLP